MSIHLDKILGLVWMLFPLEGSDKNCCPPILQQNPWTTFRVGMFSGVFVVLLLVALVASKLQFAASNFLLSLADGFVPLGQGWELSGSIDLQ